MKIFNGINRENYDKYGKNIAYYGWPGNKVHNAVESEAIYNTPTFTCIGKPKIVYNARYCAVSGFIYAVVDGKYSVLANQRGEGTPDFQGYWNCPCGFLERFETSKEGIAREIYEECGFRIDMDLLKKVHVETDPKECNNGNVTIRHTAFLGSQFQFDTFKVGEGGEENEVTNVKWIPVDEIDQYPWAFNHYRTIKKYAPKKWKRRIIEFFYNIF